MAPSLKSQLMADLLETDEPDPTATTLTAPNLSTTSLGHLPNEVQRTVFQYLFSYRELVFSSRSLILRTPPDAWPLAILRVSRDISEVAIEALRGALAESTLIYDGCVPPFPYDGRDHMHSSRLGKDHNIRDLYVHEVFLEIYGSLFSKVNIPRWSPRSPKFSTIQQSGQTGSQWTRNARPL